MVEFEYLEEVHCLAGLVLALHALLAIWAGLASRPRWPWRFAILLGVIAMWRPIEGRDVIVFLVLHAALICGGLLLWRGFGTRLWRWFLDSRLKVPEEEREAGREHLQLTLRDILIGTTLLAVAFALVRAELEYLPIWSWDVKLFFPLTSTCGLALAAVLAVFATGRWWWRILALLGFGWMTFVECVEASQRGYHWVIDDGFGMLGISQNIDHWAVGSYALTIFAALILWRIGSISKPVVSEGDRALHPVSAPRRTRVARWLLTGLAVGIACPIAYLYCQLSIHLPIPPRPDVAENGYERLVEIGERLEGVEIPYERFDGEKWDSKLEEFVEVPSEELAAHIQMLNATLGLFVDDHPNLMADIDEALELPCFVPVDYLDVKISFTSEEFMRLGKASIAIGRHAEQRGRMEDAVASYLRTIELGIAASSAGLLVGYMVGLVTEQIGVTSIQAMRHKFTDQQRREVAEKLLALSELREPLSEVEYRERVWRTNAFPCRWRLLLLTEDWLGIGDSLESMQDHRDAQLASYRLLATELAIDVFRNKQGRVPETLEELVPDLLPRVLQDPFAEAPLCYRRIDVAEDSQGYLLYSRGKNSVDDGGVVVTEEGRTLTRQQAATSLAADDELLDEGRGDLFLDRKRWTAESTQYKPVEPLSDEELAAIEAAKPAARAVIEAEKEDEDW